MQPELLVRLPEILSIRLTPRITHQVTPRLGICSASEFKLLQSCKRPISIPFYYSLAEEMKSTSSERFFFDAEQVHGCSVIHFLEVSSYCPPPHPHTPHSGESNLSSCEV